MNYQYTKNNMGIIDITKPPYCADNTGREDCTEILIRAFDDILRQNVINFENTKKKLEAMPDPNAMISFEIRKVDGLLDVIFPEKLEPAKIIYFPNGTYLVSDTITYTLDNLMNLRRNIPYMEMCRQIYLKGESRDGVVIKLKDNCPSFRYGAKKPVINYIQADKSNIAMTNVFENITIDIGKGNAGAIGIVFYGNNTGGIKNIRVVSSDLDHKGYAGVVIQNEIVSGCYIKDVEIDGFDYGVRATPVRNFMVFENIDIKNSRKAGFFVGHAIISIRHLTCNCNVPGLVVEGALSHLVLVDSQIRGNNPYEPAIEIWAGSSFIRNVQTEGFKCSITYSQDDVGCEDYVEEYISDSVYTAFENKPRSIPVEVEETPFVEWSTNEDDWCCVNDYGAVGDGETDDTAAIQQAFNSGKDFVFFQPGAYFISSSIIIPENIKRVNFMYCNFVASDELKEMKDRGVFIVTGDEGIIMLEDVFTWEKFYGYLRFIEHAGKRTLVMSDIQTQTAAQYFNSVEGGKVFIENCGCTLGGDPYRDVPGYSFKGQRVWARHINPERSFTEILNDNSKVWIMGFKTENYGTAFKTINGGHTEVLGGTISIGTNQQLPAIVNDNSTVSVVASTNGYSLWQYYPIAVEETQNGVKKVLTNEVFPLRLLNNYKIPLYVGEKKN